YWSPTGVVVHRWVADRWQTSPGPDRTNQRDALGRRSVRVEVGGGRNHRTWADSLAGRLKQRRRRGVVGRKNVGRRSSVVGGRIAQKHWLAIDGFGRHSPENNRSGCSRRGGGGQFQPVTTTLDCARSVFF